jgi:hypothetical protein
MIDQGPAIQGSQQARRKETMHVISQKEIGVAIGPAQHLTQENPELQPRRPQRCSYFVDPCLRGVGYRIVAPHEAWIVSAKDVELNPSPGHDPSAIDNRWVVIGVRINHRLYMQSAAHP